jgi:alpha-tubulin suppressor-like RCC1 family protein
VNVTSVTIGGTELVGRTVVSTTEITGTAPASTSSGARDVVVTSASHGGGTCSACFTYNPSVTVTAVSPASGPLAGGTSVTITGTNFANVISVTIDGVELASRTVVSATEITGTTPTATAAGAKDAVVTSSSHGSGTCVSCFTYVSYVVEWASVSAGWQFTCGLLTTGAAYCWGYNGLGRLGNGSTQPSFNPLPVAVTGGFTFSAVSAGLMHACGVTGGGAAYCWGDNRYGALGNGLQNGFDSVPGAVTGGLTFGAVTAGYEYTCGLTREGAAYCWGWNGGGLLGTGSTADIIRVPEAVSGGLTLAAVAAGYFAHTCGLTTGGAAYCWGDNGNGQLGDGSTSYSVVPVAVSGGLTFAAVSAGGGHSCGLTTGGAAYCWGANGVGELGTGSTTSSLVPVPVSGGLRFSALAAGEGYSCAITSAGAAYCWGWNDWGQLGDGSTTNRLVPVLVTGGYTFTAVHAGYQHACGVTASGAAYCWGRGQEGQLGNGTTTTSSSVPVRVVDPP